FCSRFDNVILDEVTEAKTQGTITARICRKLSELCRRTYALTGTPMGNDPTDLHEPMFFIDRGYSLGETLSLFRAALFKVQKGRAGFPKGKFDARKRALLLWMLGHRSLRIGADEADLPQKVAIHRYVRLPEEAHACHQR